MVYWNIPHCTKRTQKRLKQSNGDYCNQNTVFAKVKTANMGISFAVSNKLFFLLLYFRVEAPQGRDSGNNFLFPFLLPFLKITRYLLKLFLCRSPKNKSCFFSFPGIFQKILFLILEFLLGYLSFY